MRYSLPHVLTHSPTYYQYLAIQLTQVFHYLPQVFNASSSLHLPLSPPISPHLPLSPQVFNASTARSWSSEVYNPCPGVMEGVPASRDYEGGFSHDLMLKDLSLALRAAAQAGAPAPSGEHAMRLYSMSAASGLAGKDFGGRRCTPRHSPRLTRVLCSPCLTLLYSLHLTVLASPYYSPHLTVLASPYCT